MKFDNIRICRSFWSQIHGLMFRQKQPLLMIFQKEKKISLHTWFVFFPIDVYLLDSHQVIREVKQNLRPFSFWQPKEKAKYVLELPSPTGQAYRVGERIKIFM